MGSPAPPPPTVEDLGLAAELPSRRLGSRFNRALAFEADQFLIGLLGFVVGVGGFILSSSHSSLAQIWVHLHRWGPLGISLAGALYFGILNSRIGGGQTFGKRWRGLQTVDSSGNTISLPRSLARYAVWALLFANIPTVAVAKIPISKLWTFGLLPDILDSMLTTLGLATIYLVLANRCTQQGLHDLLVGTYVVDANSSGPVRFPPVWRGHWWVVGVGAVAIVTVTTWTLSRAPYDRLDSDQRAIEKIIGIDSVEVEQLTISEGNTSRVGFSVSASTASPQSEWGDLASKIAATILQQDPKVRNGDFLKIEIKTGFEIAGFSLWSRGNFNRSPGEWEEKLKTDALNHAANAALERDDYRVAVDLFKRVVQVEPTHRTAWNNLGRAYMGLHQTDKAVEAFRKHTEVHEDDEAAYDNLGWAYRREGKYEEAAAAYQKAIEINPQSQTAHAALGRVYLDLKQYDKAVPELGKAVSLEPDNANLQVELGGAYVNLGTDDKAMAAFDRAVQISATPDTWNGIAYYLAAKQVHLDKAQQYAESAVATTTAALRNVTLDQLRPEGLVLVYEVMIYWGTLGEVYLAKGDLDNADKYLSASWALAQDPEVCDDLGRLYEKRGRKDDAVFMYAVGLNTSTTFPATRGRLAALVGEKKVDEVVARHKKELQRLRTIKLGKVAKETGSAEFFVMLGLGRSGITIESVKFISGDEKLRGFADPLRNAKYDMSFPDETPARIVRRGTLSCSTQTQECVFVMVPVNDVHSVD